MTAQTPINAIPMPSSGDQRNIESAVQPGLLAVDSKLVARFATTTARNTSIPTPTPGMQAYCDDTEEMYMFSGITNSWVGLTPRVRVRTVDQSCNNTTAFQQDNKLYFPVEANSSYNVVYNVNFRSDPAADFKWKFAIPAGTYGYEINNAYTQLEWPFGNQHTDMCTWTTVVACQTWSGITMTLHITGQLTTFGTAGSFLFYWSQNVVHNSVTAVFARSYATMHKYA